MEIWNFADIAVMIAWPPIDSTFFTIEAELDFQTWRIAKTGSVPSSLTQ